MDECIGHLDQYDHNLVRRDKQEYDEWLDVTQGYCSTRAYFS